MAWEPTATERDMELLLLGAMLGNQAVAKQTLEKLGGCAFYNSDVALLVDCLKQHLAGKPLKENTVFVGWCKRRGFELNGKSVVDSLACKVDENGKRRAATAALTKAKFGHMLKVDDAIEQLQKALTEIQK